MCIVAVGKLGKNKKSDIKSRFYCIYIYDDDCIMVSMINVYSVYQVVELPDKNRASRFFSKPNRASSTRGERRCKTMVCTTRCTVHINYRTYSYCTEK